MMPAAAVAAKLLVQSMVQPDQVPVIRVVPVVPVVVPIQVAVELQFQDVILRVIQVETLLQIQDQAVAAVPEAHMEVLLKVVEMVATVLEVQLIRKMVQQQLVLLLHYLNQV